jgi:AcrR family transcriptional regulator
MRTGPRPEVSGPHPCTETNGRAIVHVVSKGEATRTAILDDALQVASRLGFAGLTIGRLADDTEMSKSGLFAHFKSKQELQLQTLEHARRRFIDVAIRPALAAPRGERRLRTLFDGWRAWDEAPVGGCVFIAASVEFDDQAGPVRDALVQSQRDWLELISTVAGTAADEGEFHADLDTDQFAFELQGIMLANHHSRRLLHDDRADERAQAAFESLVARARAA